MQAVSIEEFDVFTLGFSNRTWEETADLLSSYDVRRLIDIRVSPRSRHTPQFNRENVETRLPELGIEYVHLKDLGGFRKPDPDSLQNAGWQDASFRGYADYMQTDRFAQALKRLIESIRSARTVYVCTENAFHRCHRALVSDALALNSFRIGHIVSATRCDPHKMTGFARVDGDRITYPGLF